MSLENFDLADALIWGGLTVIILRFMLPKILEWIGLPVTKGPKGGGRPDDSA